MFTRAWFASLFLLIVVPACGRKPPAPATPAPETQAQPAAAPALETQPQPVAAETPAATQPMVGDVNIFLTSQLAIFIQQNGRLPKDFAEFSRVRLDSIPRTPAGMKWAINTVTREVKLVKE